MKCPLIQPNYDCGEEECGWWLLYSECCAVKALGELAQDESVERLEKEKKQLHVKSFAEAESLSRKQKIDYLELKIATLKAEVGTLKEQNAKDKKYYMFMVTQAEKKLKVAEAENFTLGLDSFHTLKLENIKLKDRLAKAQDVLEDICHHVGKDCFATCKGDWSGTACLTYRIFDAMNGGQPPKGDSCTKGEDTK